MSSGRTVPAARVHETRLELFVRSLAPDTARTQQEAVIERLRRLSGRESVSMEVYLSGKCVCPDSVAAETETGRFLLERFETFENWAEERGVDLVGFRRRCVDSSVTGESVTGVTFPRLCLAEFVDDRLRFVSPSSGETATTVADRLDEIERQTVGDAT